MLPRLKPWETLHALVTRLGTNKLTGQTALIIGAHGESLALARKLAAAGCKLALCSADPRQLVLAQRELEASGCAVFARQCDSRDARRVEALVEAVLHHFGSLDILITSAEPGGAAEGAVRGELEEALGRVFWAAYHPTMAVLPHMLARRAGRIVHVHPQSALGRTGSVRAARSLLRGFSEGLRPQLARQGIEVRSLRPGRLRGLSEGALQLARSLLPGRMSSLLTMGRPAAMTLARADLDTAVSRADLNSLVCFHQVQERSDRKVPCPSPARASHADADYTAGPSTLLRAALGGSRY